MVIALQQTGVVAMPKTVVQVTHSRKEGGDQKLELYGEGMEHAKVCHVLSLMKSMSS